MFASELAAVQIHFIKTVFLIECMMCCLLTTHLVESHGAFLLIRHVFSARSGGYTCSNSFGLAMEAQKDESSNNLSVPLEFQ